MYRTQVGVRGDALAEGSRLCSTGRRQDTASNQGSRAVLPGLALPGNSQNLSEPTYLLCERKPESISAAFTGRGMEIHFSTVMPHTQVRSDFKLITIYAITIIQSFLYKAV